MRLANILVPGFFVATAFLACTSSGSNGTDAGGGSGGSDNGGTNGEAGSGGDTGGSGGEGGMGGEAGQGGLGGEGGEAGEAGGGGMAGEDGGGGEGGMAGSTVKKAVAEIAPFSSGNITGTATFEEVDDGVKVTIEIANCMQGNYPTHIHTGPSCESMETQGMHWDHKRGEDIGPGGGRVTCGANMTGTVTHVRSTDDASLKWTLGDGSNTDVIGRVVVVHGLGDSSQRLGCGEIKLVE